MKTRGIITFIFLGLAYLWLAWSMVVYAGGFSLKNILLLVMSAIIIFVPVYKKFRNNDDGPSTPVS